jgi:serine/threonine-protein kinase RsbW
MDIAFTVHLPASPTSVSFIRGLCRQALEHLRVNRTVVEDIALALTETCVHVVERGGEHAQYDVHVTIDDALCRISVVGDGLDLDALSVSAGPPPLGEARGRLLLQALVDGLEVQRESGGRQRLTLEKRLVPPRPLRLVDPV